MAKVSLMDLPISTFAPEQEGMPYLAFFGRPGRAPIFFKGKTSMRAHMAATTWRDEQLAKGKLTAPDGLVD